MYKVVKLFEFEAAHQLCHTMNEGCKRIHGHTYKLEVELSNNILNEESMVCDFTKFSQIVKDVIIQKFDHKLILINKDFEQMSVHEDTVYLPQQPTAEHMAKIIFNTLVVYLPELTRVRLWETSNSYAEYIRDQI